MKSPVVLYIACSLDGYIADESGGIGFLEESTVPMAELGYDGFYEQVGTLIMGGKTYRQVAEELSPDAWPYEGKATYVYSRQKSGANGPATFTDLPPADLVAHIRREREGMIWLMGGGEMIRLFLDGGLIDRFMIYVMPVLLGNGIPLFPSGFPKTGLTLESIQSIGGIAEMIYVKK